MTTPWAVAHNRAHFTFAALFLLAGTEAAVRAEESTSRARSAEELVQAALTSELRGPSNLRAELLAEALSRDPDFAPARWQSGYVKFDGQWIKVGDVPRHARANEMLAEYRKLRDALIDTADNHRELARWCHKRKLADEARVHWARVLEFERNDSEAIAALGLQLYGGRLLTKSQIENERKQAADTERAWHEWQPKLMKWRKAIEQGTPKQLDEALRGLREIDDPAAIPALEAVFSVPAKAKKSSELNGALIGALSRFPHQQATDVLLRRAVMSDSQEVCAAAADQLKKRPMHTYVPTLIAAIPNRLSTRFNVLVLPNGMVSHEHELYLEGQDSDYSLTIESLFSPTDTALATFTTPLAAYRELVKAASIEHVARARRAITDAWQTKIRWVLERTTGFDNVNDPALWKAQYESHYTGNYSPSVKPVYYQTLRDAETAAPLPTETRTTTSLSNVRPHNCFPAGTQVATVLGPMPIESIKIGDLVLSQDVQTGEVRFSPVQSTTLRQPTHIVAISVGTETVLATQAHPLWIVGHGWKPAKLLQLGDRLHTLAGSVTVDRLDDSRPVEAYNLVVSERHNYFVGASQLLVHDNSALESTAEALPGLPSPVETKTRLRD